MSPEARHTQQDGHAHGHAHAASGNLGVAFALNFGFALFELVGGALTNSVAVLSDALHDLGDSLSLGVAWLLNRYAARAADGRYSYGYRRFALLGAFFNAAILIGGSVFVVREALARLAAPEPFHEVGLIGMALVGIVVNGAAVVRLRQGGSLSERVISWHLIEDVLGWTAVLVVGVVSLFVDAPILDPLLSLGISAFVLVNAVRALWSTVRVFLQAVPDGVDIDALYTALTGIDGVCSVHNLRVWSLDGEHHVLSAHLVVEPETDTPTLQRIKRESRSALAGLHLDDAALQLDFGEEDCR